MSKSNHFVNEASSKLGESPAHKTRRKEQERLSAITTFDNIEEVEDEEYETFERIPRKPKKIKR